MDESEMQMEADQMEEYGMENEYDMEMGDEGMEDEYGQVKHQILLHTIIPLPFPPL